MLKLGNKIISDIYLGDKKIAKVFLGDKLVYQAGKPIFLDYIITDGNSWIDTGYVPTLNTEITFTYQGNNQNSWFFGCRNSTVGYGIGAGYHIASYVSFGTNFTGTNSGTAIWYGAKNTITLNRDSFLINGVNNSGLANFGTNLSDSNLLLFTINSTSSIDKRMFVGKCYGFTIKENGVLVQDLRPCIAPNGQVAMYDEVNKKYHYNQGTGELKAGGRFVNSILFDGASWIDTGISHQTCTVECDIRFEETGTRQLMGFGTGSGHYWGAGATGIFDYMSDTNALDRTDVVIDFNAEEINYTIYADGKSRTSANGNKLASLTYRIGAGPTGASSNAYWCTCEVWGNKFTVNGELIQDLRPYVDEDGTACFKDVVTGNLFYNQGTGTLGYTEEQYGRYKS